MRFRQALDVLHCVAGQVRHAPPREGVVQDQPEHLVKQNTFLSGHLLEQRKPWVVVRLDAVSPIVRGVQLPVVIGVPVKRILVSSLSVGRGYVSATYSKRRFQTKSRNNRLVKQQTKWIIIGCDSIKWPAEANTCCSATNYEN